MGALDGALVPFLLFAAHVWTCYVTEAVTLKVVDLAERDVHPGALLYTFSAASRAETGSERCTLA